MFTSRQPFIYGHCAGPMMVEHQRHESNNGDNSLHTDNVSLARQLLVNKKGWKCYFTKIRFILRCCITSCSKCAFMYLNICTCTSMQRQNIPLCVQVHTTVVLHLLFGKINASPLMLSCPLYGKWMEGVDEEAKVGRRVRREVHIKWMRCKWHQRTWESIYVIKTNESSSAMPWSAFPFILLAAPVVIVINPPNPNPWPFLTQTANPSTFTFLCLPDKGPFYPNEKALKVPR